MGALRSPLHRDLTCGGQELL